MPHVFISYAKKDTRDLALSLADVLNAVDRLTVWVDRSLRAGRSWELQIQAEIDRCDAMVVLYSPDINRHKDGHPESYVLTEIAYAKYTLNKLIIPIMAQTTTPPMALTMEHYIDYTIASVKLSDLVDEICAELDADVRATSIPPEVKQSPVLSKSLLMMPKPFEWIDIPNKGYSISKYPITNAQFRKFIDAEGYNQREWWTGKGWEYRTQGDWTKPQYWTEVDWNSDMQPVIGISWFEAVAFCLWLSKLTEGNITLPSQSQWQFVAQSTDERKFPWGNSWNQSNCNHNVDKQGIRKTTPVIQYEGKGDSPFGVVDMAGNVWEWCLTDYEKSTNDIHTEAKTRVVCGGSWMSDLPDFFHTDLRGNHPPEKSYYDIGFRVVRL